MRSRPSSTARGYGATWKRLRLQILNREPLCRPCSRAGRVTAAIHVDHLIALADGGTNSPDNLEPCCQPCHSRKTVQHDGGFGR